MVKEQPCGCKTKPLNRSYKIKNHLLAGDIVWFDDPRCETHHGTGINGFMIYVNGVVHSSKTENGKEIGIKIPLSFAILELEELFESGLDFSVGKAKLEVINNDFQLSCGGSF